jgi:serine/threonine protein kinase
MLDNAHNSKTERNNSSSLKTKNYEQDILGDFIIGKTLGKGAFGKVKLGIHKITGEKVINKI